MTDFASAVKEALDSVPHGPDCGKVGGGIDHFTAFACSCDRPVRQAERVAAAIEAAVRFLTYTGLDGWRRAALSALRGGGT